MLVLGYVFTVLGYLAYWIGRFFKKKSVLMLTNSLSSAFFIGQFFCFGSYNGMANSCLVVARGLAVNLKDKLKKPLHWLFCLFILAFIGTATIFWSGWPSIFTTITMFINIYANWYLPPQKLRLATCIASVFAEIFLLSLGNYLGMLFELTIIASNLISWFKYHKGVGCYE